MFNLGDFGVRRMNMGIIIAVLLLMVIGLFFIFSASYSAEDLQRDSGLPKYARQIIWIVVGFICYFIASMVDPAIIRKFDWWLYGGALFLLLAVLIFGVDRYGARRWLDVLGTPVQPSELAKVAVILLLASWFTRQEDDPGSLSTLAVVFAVVAVPWVLILLQPDLGTAMSIAGIAFIMMFCGGVSMRILGTMVIIGVTFVSLLVGALILPEKLNLSEPTQKTIMKCTGLSEYHRKRILVFAGMDADPLGASYNKIQSKISVGSGGFSGKGYMKGSQNLLGFLPKTVAPTDFIYSVIAEETGFIGSTVVILLFGLLIGSILHTALLAPDMFGRLFCVGTASLIFVHVFVNIAMTVGLLPITGIPLPLLSYGGSFMVVIMSALGVVQGIRMRSRGGSEDFEYIWKASVN